MNSNWLYWNTVVVHSVETRKKPIHQVREFSSFDIFSNSSFTSSRSQWRLLNEWLSNFCLLFSLFVKSLSIKYDRISTFETTRVCACFVRHDHVYTFFKKTKQQTSTSFKNTFFHRWTRKEEKHEVMKHVFDGCWEGGKALLIIYKKKKRNERTNE